MGFDLLQAPVKLRRGPSCSNLSFLRQDQETQGPPPCRGIVSVVTELSNSHWILFLITSSSSCRHRALLLRCRADSCWLVSSGRQQTNRGNNRRGKHKERGNHFYCRHGPCRPPLKPFLGLTGLSLSL